MCKCWNAADQSSLQVNWIWNKANELGFTETNSFALFQIQWTSKIKNCFHLELGDCRKDTSWEQNFKIQREIEKSPSMHFDKNSITDFFRLSKKTECLCWCSFLIIQFSAIEWIVLTRNNLPHWSYQIYESKSIKTLCLRLFFANFWEFENNKFGLALD